jgi:uncharacterized SAM-binding protein YcdF (DUF218 family)
VRVSEVRWPWLFFGGLLVLAVLVVVGARPLALWLVRPLVKADPLRRVDAIVVLGAGSYPAGVLTPETAYRVLLGIRLMHEAYAPVLVLSGGSHRGTPGSDAEAMARAARACGIASTSLLLDDGPSNTAAQAASMVGIAARHQIRSIALVTSPLKSYRAARAFQRAGLEVVSAPGIAGGAAQPLPLLVAEDHLARRLGVILDALTEYAALAVYWFRGWI